MASMLEILQSKGQTNHTVVSEYLTAQAKVKEAVAEFLASVEIEKAHNKKVRELKSRRNAYVANILNGVNVDESRSFAEEINRTLRNMGAF